ncbi:uncharacterized protein LOC132266796 isoform X1 [Cornus florida]|uniref:uncharacterized protein LOC132266796 isoform X1 n=1 Tax=Cornus florida TaxID=4283 RepID=UPI002897B380|nr:uncharacterized protein LOC132266796 isoform X1 [Cornus florida]
MVGVICREHARMTCGTWSHMESADKATLYHHIQDNFVIDLDNSRIRNGLDKWLAARFRSHKNRMHMHFKSFGDDVERARRKPYRNVRPGDWQAICENFMTPTFQNKSAVNKVNKAKNLTNHRGGSKPFVTLRYEMRNMETEEEPDMVTFYHRTHCREDGTWVTQHCQGLYDKMIQEVN